MYSHSPPVSDIDSGEESEEWVDCDDTQSVGSNSNIVDFRIRDAQIKETQIIESQIVESRSIDSEQIAETNLVESQILESDYEIIDSQFTNSSMNSPIGVLRGLGGFASSSEQIENVDSPLLCVDARELRDTFGMSDEIVESLGLSSRLTNSVSGSVQNREQSHNEDVNGHMENNKEHKANTNGVYYHSKVEIIDDIVSSSDESNASDTSSVDSTMDESNLISYLLGQTEEVGEDLDASYGETTLLDEFENKNVPEEDQQAAHSDLQADAPENSLIDVKDSQIDSQADPSHSPDSPHKMGQSSSSLDQSSPFDIYSNAIESKIVESCDKIIEYKIEADSNPQNFSAESVENGTEEGKFIVPSKSKSIDEVAAELKKNASYSTALKPFTVIENYFSLPLVKSTKVIISDEGKRALIEKVRQGETLSSAEFKIYRKLRVELAKIKVWEEYRSEGYNAQFLRDGEMWYRTLHGKGEFIPILKRIFITIRYGGLLFREWTQDKAPYPKWQFWRKRGWPIASVLSHGSRVIIQLGKETENEKNRFWNWLITGNPNSNASRFISTQTSSEKAHKEGKILFKRMAATHSLDFFPQKMQLQLPGNRKKIIHEIKTLGLTDTKILASRKRSLQNHSHWGMNIPVGGLGEEPLLYQLTKNEMPLTKEEAEERMDASGRYGHVYIYYLSPNNTRYGAVMIGVENSEPNVKDSLGNHHDYKARSPTLSPTFGYKWWKDGDKPDLRMSYGPGKYNGMLIDLTEGWEFLTRKEWKNSFVRVTSERPRPLPKIKLDEWLKENIEVPKEFKALL